MPARLVGATRHALHGIARGRGGGPVLTMFIPCADMLSTGKVAADLFYSRARPFAGMPVVTHPTRINAVGTTFSK